MAKILLLGASEIQVPSILRAKALGHTVLVADYNPSAPGLSLADIPLVISTNDIDSILVAARQHGIDGIVTTSDFPVRTVAAVGAALGLSVLSEESALACTDKYRQRALIAGAGLPTPWFFRLTENDCVNSSRVLSWPAIVKPVDSSASRGVSRVDHETGFPAAVQRAMLSSPSKVVIVEEFIGGSEFSVEVLCHDGLVDVIAVTGKTTAGKDGLYFVETRHIIPAGILPQEDEAIRSSVQKAVSACGLTNAAAHAEVKLSPCGPVLIEMAARLGGDYITSELVPLATGVDMVGAIVQMALGQSIRPQQTCRRFSGIQFVTPENHAMAAVKIAALRNHPGLRCSQLLPKPENAELRSSMDRLGYWVAVADSREELLQLLDCEN